MTSNKAQENYFVRVVILAVLMIFCKCKVDLMLPAPLKILVGGTQTLSRGRCWSKESNGELCFVKSCKRVLTSWVEITDLSSASAKYLMDPDFANSNNSIFNL